MSILNFPVLCLSGADMHLICAKFSCSHRQKRHWDPVGGHLAASPKNPFLLSSQKATIRPCRPPFCCLRQKSIPALISKSNNKTLSATILLLPQKIHSCSHLKKQQWDPVGRHFAASIPGSKNGANIIIHQPAHAYFGALHPLYHHSLHTHVFQDLYRLLW